MSAQEWSILQWKSLHDAGYFPTSDEHKDWMVFDHVYRDLAIATKPNSSDDCLEIGCGYGEWMIPLSKTVNTVSGCDIHSAPLIKAIELFEQHKVTNCSVGLCSGITVPYPSNSFSLVYSISVFQHIPRSIVASYLSETVRLMRGGGRCFHHFRNSDNVGPFPIPADDIVENHTGDFSCGWTKEQVLCAAGVAGIEKICVADIGLFLILTGAKS